ncbi:GNAT family N-acetyltransferase [Streptomyces physcomitrii]|uniref:GNAT family N-acetyltransferase n=1 Tax=Streptomyces physcomitrii TaxID=2724184 RepID=UPI0033C51EB4
MIGTREASRSDWALLADGATARIRPVRPDDEPALEEMYRAMGTGSLRNRFFAVGSGLGTREAARLCRPQRRGRRALLAFERDRLLGAAGYESGEDPGRAEVALAVAEGQHARGVGTLLVEELVHLARRDGVTLFTADTLVGNHLVQHLFADLGLPVRHGPPDPAAVVPWSVALEPDERYLAALDKRDRTAQVAGLRSLLQPDSVMVVGAGRGAEPAARVLANLRSAGFPGRVHLVSAPGGAADRAGYPPPVSAAESADLAVLAVPAHSVPRAAAACGEVGVRSLLVLGSRLDRAQRYALLSACRRWSMRLVGPGSLGVVNTRGPAVLDPTDGRLASRRGSTGVAVQDPGMASALLGGLDRLGVGLSAFVGLGETDDVGEGDLLQWWAQDRDTDMILLHLRSPGDPRRFARLARKVSAHKPVLTVAPDNGVGAGRDAAAVTGLASAMTVTRRHLVEERIGLTVTRTLTGLLEVTALMRSQPLPSGRRVVVVSGERGIGEWAAQACAQVGLAVPELPLELVHDLLRLFPSTPCAGNPVVTGSAIRPEQLQRCLALLGGSDAVDAVVLASTLPPGPGDPADGLIRSARAGAVAGCQDLGKPCAAVLLGQPEAVRLVPGGADDRRLPVYGEARSAAAALVHAERRSRWLRRCAAKVVHFDDCGTDEALALVGRLLREAPAGGPLAPRHAARLLDLYRIPVPRPPLVPRPPPAGAPALIAGAVQDPVLGPLVLYGAGDSAAEVIAERAVRPAPLTTQDVTELLDTQCCAALITGQGNWTGNEPGPLRELLARLSQLACEIPQLSEVQLRVVDGRDTVTVTAAHLRVQPPAPLDPYTRVLP